MNIALAIAALAISGFTAFSFYKAGYYKATATRESMLEAGFGWIEKLPLGIVRFIAWLEIIGAAGLVIAPTSAYFIPGLEWAQVWGISAAAGLALTMVGAAALHIARKEFAYTWKMNLSLLSFAVVSGAVQLLVSAPVIS